MREKHKTMRPTAHGNMRRRRTATRRSHLWHSGVTKAAAATRETRWPKLQTLMNPVKSQSKLETPLNFFSFTVHSRNAMMISSCPRKALDEGDLCVWEEHRIPAIRSESPVFICNFDWKSHTTATSDASKALPPTTQNFSYFSSHFETK